MNKIIINSEKLNEYELMANLARIAEFKKLSKYRYDKKFLNKKTK